MKKIDFALSSILDLLSMEKIVDNERVNSEVEIFDSTEQQILENLMRKTDELSLLDENSKPYKRSKFQKSLRLKLESIYLYQQLNDLNQTTMQRTIRECYFKIALINILKTSGQHSLAAKLAQKALKTSLKYDFTDSTLSLCSFLSTYFINYNYNKKKLDKYRLLSKRYMRVLQEETRLKWMHDDLYNMIENNKNIDAADLKNFELPIYEEELASISRLYPMYYFLICIMHYEINGDYELMYESAEKGYNELSKKSYNHSAGKYIFRNYMSNGQLMLKNWAGALQILDIEKHELYQGANWFISQQLRIRLLIKLEKYYEAYVEHSNLVKHRMYKQQKELNKDKINLVGIFIQFLIYIGMVPEGKKMDKRTITKSLYQSSLLHSDTTGYKISVTIAQLLFMIYERDYSGIEMRIYSLKSYCNKYLVKKSANYRSNCFIKMLLNIPLGNFHPVAVERKAARYTKMLNEVSQEFSSESMVVEIIPYEKLWKIILSYLKSPGRRRPNAMKKENFFLN